MFGYLIIAQSIYLVSAMMVQCLCTFIYIYIYFMIDLQWEVYYIHVIEDVSCCYASFENVILC